MELLYIYGISKGIPGPKLHIKLETISKDKSVEIFSYNDLQAIYSKVLSEEFDDENLRKNFKDMNWISDKAFAHENVIGEIMEKYPVVPMRFCTIYNSAENLQMFLANYYGKLAENVEVARKNEEWGLKVFYENRVIRGNIERRDKFQRELEDIMSKSKGIAYLLKKKFDDRIDTQIEIFVNESIQKIYEKIKKIVKDVVVKELVKTDSGEAKCAANLVMLIEKEWRDGFVRRIELLISEYESQGYIFELKGPWPIYNHIDVMER